MEPKILKKRRVFWTWQDEEEEAWLREMAQQGWHLLKPGLLGYYTFQEGEPSDMVYRLDYIPGKFDHEEYLLLFADAGWEFVGEMWGWQYFRKEALAGEEPQIFTDPESKIQKYRHLLGYFIIFLPIWVVLLNNIGDFPYGYINLIFGLFFLFITLTWGYLGIRILLRIRELNHLRIETKK
jgi:hypothetical protein